MKRSYLVFSAFALLIACNTAFAQTNHYGDARRAELSSHKTGRELKEPVARLGYLDNGVATPREFMDNLEAGLTLPGFHRNRIVSYKVLYLPKLADEMKTDKIKGAKMPREIFDALHLAEIKSGDVILFEDIRIENNDRIYTVTEPVRVVIL
jgi:hypothetical protein